MQKNLLRLSSAGRQVVVPNSGHYINQDQPKVIEDAAKEMLFDIRSKSQTRAHCAGQRAKT